MLSQSQKAFLTSCLGGQEKAIDFVNNCQDFDCFLLKLQKINQINDKLDKDLNYEREQRQILDAINADLHSRLSKQESEISVLNQRFNQENKLTNELVDAKRQVNQLRQQLSSQNQSFFELQHKSEALFCERNSLLKAIEAEKAMNCQLTQQLQSYDINHINQQQNIVKLQANNKMLADFVVTQLVESSELKNAIQSCLAELSNKNLQLSDARMHYQSVQIDFSQAISALTTLQKTVLQQNSALQTQQLALIDQSNQDSIKQSNLAQATEMVFAELQKNDAYQKQQEIIIEKLKRQIEYQKQENIVLIQRQNAQVLEFQTKSVLLSVQLASNRELVLRNNEHLEQLRSRDQEIQLLVQEIATLKRRCELMQGSSRENKQQTENEQPVESKDSELQSKEQQPLEVECAAAGQPVGQQAQSQQDNKSQSENEVEVMENSFLNSKSIKPLNQSTNQIVTSQAQQSPAQSVSPLLLKEENLRGEDENGETVNSQTNSSQQHNSSATQQSNTSWPSKELIGQSAEPQGGQLQVQQMEIPIQNELLGGAVKNGNNGSTGTLPSSSQVYGQPLAADHHKQQIAEQNKSLLTNIQNSFEKQQATNDSAIHLSNQSASIKPPKIPRNKHKNEVSLLSGERPHIDMNMLDSNYDISQTENDTNRDTDQDDLNRFIQNPAPTVQNNDVSINYESIIEAKEEYNPQIFTDILPTHESMLQDDADALHSQQQNNADRSISYVDGVYLGNAAVSGAKRDSYMSQQSLNTTQNSFMNEYANLAMKRKLKLVKK